jgi:O-antigen/teichoic acid export membrane protein
MAAAAAGSLTYLGAVMLPVLVGTPTSAVGTYLAALSLGRLPLFALSPLIAIAVPRIAYAMEAGDTVRARRSAGWFMAMAATGALLVVGVAASVGSGALVALFGAGFAVRAGSLLAIGFGAACWLFASAAASVAIAAGHDYLAAAAWFAALAASIGAAAVSGPDPFDRTDAAVISGAMVAAIATGLSALVALRGRLDAVGIRA